MPSSPTKMSHRTNAMHQLAHIVETWLQHVTTLYGLACARLVLGF